MRSLSLSITLLALAILLMLAATFYLRADCRRLLQNLPDTATEQQETVLAQEIARWESRTPLYCMIAPRSSIRRVRELMLTLQSYRRSNCTAAAEVTLAQLRDTVEQLRKDALMIVPQ